MSTETAPPGIVSPVGSGAGSRFGGLASWSMSCVHCSKHFSRGAGEYVRFLGRRHFGCFPCIEARRAQRLEKLAAAAAASDERAGEIASADGPSID